MRHVAHGFDVVRIGVAHERPEVVGVILARALETVENLGTALDGFVVDPREADRASCATTMCDSRNSSPVVRGPVQKVAWGDSRPMSSPTFVTRDATTRENGVIEGGARDNVGTP